MASRVNVSHAGVHQGVSNSHNFMALGLRGPYKKRTEANAKTIEMECWDCKKV